MEPLSNTSDLVMEKNGTRRLDDEILNRWLGALDAFQVLGMEILQGTNDDEGTPSSGSELRPEQRGLRVMAEFASLPRAEGIEAR